MTDGPAALLAVEELSAFYGSALILDGLSLSVAPGEVVALLGRNGAGKSTVLKAVLGLVPRRLGRVTFEGADISRLPTHEIVRRGIGWVPEDRRIFTELTTLENLEVGRRDARPGAPHWTVEALIRLFPNLAELADRPAGRMSGGEQQMLTIARTLMGNPSLVLLDEPSEGLAPRIVEEMTRMLATLKREGLALLLSEQNLTVARALADRVYVMEKGRVRFTGTMAELDARPDVRDAYLAV
ncbi:ABC transporter ATP-binding protein [Tistrella mobilis]